MIAKVMRAVRKSEGGAVAVEMAVLAPLIFFLFAGLVDLGLMLYQRTVVGTAADAGALYALVTANPAVPIDSTYQSGIQNAVTESYSLSFPFGPTPALQATPAPLTKCGCPTATFSINAATCGTNCPISGLPAGVYAVVSAQSNYKPILPWTGVMGANAVLMTATSWIRIQ